MTTLSIYNDKQPDRNETFTNFDQIREQLRQVGVQLEHWQADQPLPAEAGEQEVLDAYQEDISRLHGQYGFQSVDVISLRPDNPKKTEMRQKFLSEHTHDDFEVRFFVEGQGIFYLHIDGRVYAVLCTRGDLISVPAGTTHWFDMGTEPDFKCIRFFTTPEGWVGNFTGSDIARQFPDFDSYVSSLN